MPPGIAISSIPHANDANDDANDDANADATEDANDDANDDDDAADAAAESAPAAQCLRPRRPSLPPPPGDRRKHCEGPRPPSSGAPAGHASVAGILLGAGEMKR